MAAAEFLRGGEPVPTPQRTSNDLDGRGTPRTLKTLQQKLFANFQEEIEKTSGNTKGFLSTLNAVLLGPSPNKVKPVPNGSGKSLEEQKMPAAAGARDRLNSDDFVEVYGDDAAGLAAQVDDVDQDEDSEYDTEYYDEEESKEEQKMPAGSPPSMRPEKAPRLAAA